MSKVLWCFHCLISKNVKSWQLKLKLLALLDTTVIICFLKSAWPYLLKANQWRWVCVCVFALFACVCVLEWVCGLVGCYCLLLVAAQCCLFCGTSVGCVMGFVERCSVSGVKQAQSRAPADATGTDGLVSLSLRTHARMTNILMLENKMTLILKCKE